MEYKVKCPICGEEFNGGVFDNCPICDWCYQGIENELNENDYDELNHTSIKNAKENFKNGLDKWGDPINKD